MKKNPIKGKLDMKDVEKKVEKKVEKEEMVDGIFTNLDIEGNPVEFSINLTGVAKHYKIKDGERRTLPLSVAKHLNRCRYVDSAPRVDRHGRYLGTKERVVNRFSFRRFDSVMDDI